MSFTLIDFVLHVDRYLLNSQLSVMCQVFVHGAVSKF